MSTGSYNEWHGSPYVTGVVARVDSAGRTLTYANAGHPPGLVIRDGVDRALSEGGPRSGSSGTRNIPKSASTRTLGTSCTFVTDGITEAFDESVRPRRTFAKDAVRGRPLSAEMIARRWLALWKAVAQTVSTTGPTIGRSSFWL